MRSKPLNEFIGKLHCVSAGDSGLLNMIYWLDDDVLDMLRCHSEELDDVTLMLALEGIVRFVRTSAYDDEFSAIVPDRFIEAVVVLAPLVIAAEWASPTSKSSASESLAKMTVHVCDSRTGITDLDILRGYLLQFRLGYRTIHLDGSTAELRWLGERFNLILRNWNLFKERGSLDEGLVSVLEQSQDGARALNQGTL